jgi:Transposase DDE domain
MQAQDPDSADWNEIIDGLGGEAALAASALQHKAFVRARAIGSACDLLRLALIYGPGGHSLRTTAALAGASGIADLSDVALLNRIAGAADWLKALCEGQPARPKTAADAAGVELRIVDSTTIAAPGRGGSYRLHVSYDPQRQRIDDLHLTSMAEGERLDRTALTPGALVLADRGYPKPDGLQRLLASGAHVLVRLTWKSLHLVDEAGQPLDWTALFAAAVKHQAVDMPVWVRRPRGRFQPLKLRLVILPKPAQAAERSRAKARRAQIKGQHRTGDPRTGLAADHLILLTSLAPDQFPAQSLKELYALRWQIELAFKRMKSILNLAALPAKNPKLAAAWLYAHLLFALIIEAIAAPPGDFPPDKAEPRQPSIWRLTAFIAAILKTAMLVSARLSTLSACIPKLARQLCEPPRKRILQIHTISCLS